MTQQGNDKNATLTEGRRVSDSLKPPEKLFEQDRSFFQQDIEKRHAAIAAIILHDGVPVKVHQVFETARNLSLYAFYAYRFHQVSELMAYIAFEMALTERLHREAPPLKARGRTIPKSLERKIDLAVSEGWLKAEHFSGKRQLAFARARSRKMRADIRFMEENSLTEMEITDPSESMIAEELATMSPATALHAMRELRNALSHDHDMLSPTSIGTLQFVADGINPLFPATESVSKQ